MSTPIVGSRYVIQADRKPLVQWLVVRVHPDDNPEHPQNVFIVPCDDTPLVGGCDVQLDDPWVARCAAGQWLSASFCRQAVRSEMVANADLFKVREKIANIARGVVESNEADSDPIHMALITELITDGEYLERRFRWTRPVMIPPPH